MRIRPVVILAMVALLGAEAQAQKRGRGKARQTEKARVEELATKVEQALKVAEESANNKKLLEKVESELAAVKAELAAVKAASAAQRKARTKRAAALTKRLDTAKLELTAVKAELAGRGHKAGYKNGFFIRNATNRFLLRLRGFIQGGYEGTWGGEQVTIGSQTLGELESGFVLRRARVSMDGHMFGQFFTYKMELGFGALDPGPVVQAWGDFGLYSVFKVRAGRQKVPVSRQMLIEPAFQQFTERSSVTRAFAPGFDLGVTAHGEVPLFGVVSYQLGMFNGAGQSADTDDNTDFLYAARLLYQPLGKIPNREGDRDTGGYKVAVGGSFAANLARTDQAEREGITDAKTAAARRDLDGDLDVDNVWVYLAAAELTARLRFFLWQTEFFYRVEDPGAVGDNRKFWGIYSQFGTVPQTGMWDVAVRYGFFEPHYYGALRDTPRPDKIHEVSGVFSLFTWHRRMRWSLEYTWQHQLDLTSRSGATVTSHLGSFDTHLIRLQASLKI